MWKQKIKNEHRPSPLYDKLFRVLTLCALVLALGVLLRDRFVSNPENSEQYPVALDDSTTIAECGNHYLTIIKNNFESEKEDNYLFLNCTDTMELEQTLTVVHEVTLTGDTNHPFIISGRRAELDTLIRVKSGAKLTLENFRLLESTRFGVYVEAGGTFICRGCLFSGHGSAIGDGAAIWNEGTVDVQRSIFQDNASYDDAAAILNWNNASLKVNESIFQRNSAGQEKDGTGAGIRNNGTALIENSIFEGNENVNGAGAAVANLGGDMIIRNTVFQNNTANTGGAAVYNFTNATLSIENSQFINNTTRANTGSDLYNLGKLALYNVNSSNAAAIACFNTGTMQDEDGVCNS